MAIRNLIAMALLAAAPASAIFCKTQSQPNPIAKDYPTEVTGTINGTVVVLPIPYSVARQVVPAEYAILRDAYHEMLPDFPKDMYPAMLQTGRDHDVQSLGIIHLADFTRATVSFPFVDRLGDGYTSMSYSDRMIISALNLPAILGSKTYGYSVTGGSFDPKCDGYASAGGDPATTYFKAYDALHGGAGPKISHTFKKAAGSPYSMDFFKNITSQPIFSKSKAFCDNFIRFFNASVTLSPHEPSFVRGSVEIAKPFMPEATTWDDAWGVQMDNAFIERNYAKCDSLQGYASSD